MRFAPTLVMLTAALLSLAACGADGAPETPASRAGVVMTGDAYAGVVVK